MPCVAVRGPRASSPSGSGWNRTTAHAFVGRRSIPLSYGPLGVGRESNPQPSAYELPVAPLRSSGGRTRTCDPRLNRAIFCPLNYAGKIPGQQGPDQGLLHHFCGLSSFQWPQGTRPYRPPNAFLSVAQRVVYRNWTIFKPFENRISTKSCPLVDRYCRIRVLPGRRFGGVLGRRPQEGRS